MILIFIISIVLIGLFVGIPRKRNTSYKERYDTKKTSRKFK
ncbi:hypothetical protein N7U66_19020 [Lacinutrix neustonica]|uniref:Uncharacterized protein n=1 Tax=Lacinutrix neustonica TaxID=2980107 RepID=A0A9E8MVX1_9FLAO|nr:hypothetical protein [Lacinutrix neustonica]WAC01914.1 hypothetical protein N7U66_19020 [Lacinutrix neustonica]